MPTTKQLCLSIVFKIEIADEPPLLPDGMVEPPDPEYDGRQARLLEAMKSNPDALRDWLKLLVATEMQTYSPPKWSTLIMDYDTVQQTAVASVIASLSEEDQAYFNDMKRLDMVYESMDMFCASFVVTKEPPVVEEQLDRTVFRAGYGKIPAHEEFAT